MSEFCSFKTYLTAEKCKQAVSFLDDNDKLIPFVVASYNDYAEKHSEANIALITNPDALFRSKAEEDKFVYELKQYIRDVVGLPQTEGIRNGNNTSYSAYQKNTNQRG